jgi:hypothetical protein
MHWTWLFVDRKTKICKRCNKAVGSASPTNNACHLSLRHSLTKESKEVLDEIAASETPASSQEEKDGDDEDSKFLDYILLYAIPLARTEDVAFRKVHPTAPATRVTLRARSMAHSARRHDEALKCLRGKTVTLALDAGTVWRKYVSVVALAYGYPPLLVRMAPCESVTADAVDSIIREVVEKLKGAGIACIGVVADNASSLQKCLREGWLVPQRCAAHSLQLAVNDAFTKSTFFGDTWVAVLQVLKDNNWKEPPITRWSGKYLAMKKILDTKDADISKISPHALGKITQCCRALRPYWVATQRLQADGATVFELLRVTAWLLTLDCRSDCTTGLLSFLKGRADMLVTDVALFAAYFFPPFKRQHAPTEVRDRVGKMVRWVASRMAEAFGYGNLLKEWYRFKVEPPLWTGEGNTLTINDYCDFWTSQEDTFPALSDCIKRFVRLNPTEASCERSFSVLKFAFPRLRTSAQSDLVESTVVGMSAVAFRNRQLRFDDDEEPREEEQQGKEKEDEEDKLQPPPLNDTAVRLIMDVWNTIATEKVAKEPLLKQRRTEDQDRCGLCHELFDNHEDQPCVKCTRCYLWFGFDCVGLAAEMEPLVREREWRCPSCRRVTP